MAAESIGCSLAEAAESEQYTQYLEEAAGEPPPGPARGVHQHQPAHQGPEPCSSPHNHLHLLQCGADSPAGASTSPRALHSKVTALKTPTCQEQPFTCISSDMLLKAVRLTHVFRKASNSQLVRPCLCCDAHSCVL